MCHRKQSSEAIQPLSKMSMSSHSLKCRRSLTQFSLFHMKLTFGCQIAKDNIACDQQIQIVAQNWNSAFEKIDFHVSIENNKVATVVLVQTHNIFECKSLRSSREISDSSSGVPGLVFFCI